MIAVSVILSILYRLLLLKEIITTMMIIIIFIILIHLINHLMISTIELEYHH